MLRGSPDFTLPFLIDWPANFRCKKGILKNPADATTLPYQEIFKTSMKEIKKRKLSNFFRISCNREKVLNLHLLGGKGQKCKKKPCISCQKSSTFVFLKISVCQNMTRFFFEIENFFSFNFEL